MCLPNSQSKALNEKREQEVVQTTCAGVERAKQKLVRGILYGSLSVAFLIGGYGICMPFYQSRRDELQCDSLCYGSMTSLRSFLSLFGSALVGRMSDYGRKWCLMVGCIASLVGLFINASTFSIQGMYLGMIPGALLQQNFSVLKALLADFHAEVEQEETKASENNDKRTNNEKDDTGIARAGSVGKLGMSLGLSFMIGPLVGGTMFDSYDQTVKIAILSTIISSVFIIFLPSPLQLQVSSSKKTGIFDFFNVKAARSSGAIFLMVMRITMALAYHIFYTVWTTSLKERFNFGPSDHGKFMSFVGLAYALSQGFVAKNVIKICGPTKKVQVLMVCCIILGFGRYWVYHTKSLGLVYAIFGVIITALGIVNTILTADTSNLASSEDIGGLYGALESVESLSGIIGPIIGGFLATKISPVKAPLTAVMMLYAFVFFYVHWGYDHFVVKSSIKEPKPPQDKNK